MNQLLCDLVAWPEPFFDFKIRHFEEKKVMPIGNSMQNRTNSVLQSGVPIGNTMQLLRNLSCHSFVPNGNTMLFTNNYHCSSICAVWQHYAYLRKSRIFVVQCQTATACSFGNSLSVSWFYVFGYNVQLFMHKKSLWWRFSRQNPKPFHKTDKCYHCCFSSYFIIRTRHNILHIAKHVTVSDSKHPTRPYSTKVILLS